MFVELAQLHSIRTIVPSMPLFVFFSDFVHDITSNKPLD